MPPLHRDTRPSWVQGYGPLDRLQPMDVPDPQPATGEVRVRVAASAINPADYKVLLGHMRILHAKATPLVVGYDVSGTVDLVGSGVTSLRVGDDVFGCLPYSPFNRRGAFAEAVVVRASELAHKPTTISHRAAAAAATTGLTGLQGLRDLGRLASGGRAVVTGASGGVGPLAIGIGTRLGGDMTAVGSGAGLDMARAMGASMVWDRTRGEIPSAAMGTFDVVFDASAMYRWRQWRRVLRSGGAFVTTLPSAAFAVDKLCSVVTRTRAQMVAVKSTTAALELIAQWLVDGLEAPIDTVLPVRELAEGLERLRSGRVRGRLVVDVAGGF